MATAAFAGLLNYATMAKTHNDIRNQLEQALKGQPVTIIGRVAKVNESDRTCDIDNDGITIYGVRLQSIVGGNGGVVVYPSVGSQALCLRIEESDSYMVVSASEVDQIIINGGQNGGLLNISSLETYLDQLNTAIAAALTAVGASTAASGPTGAAKFNEMKPSLTNHEDTKIKH